MVVAACSPRYAEVRHFGLPGLREEYVLGLYVAVDHALSWAAVQGPSATCRAISVGPLGDRGPGFLDEVL